MTKDWQFAKIGVVAKPVERAEVPLAGTLYRQVGVRLWGQGAYERESIDGSQTKYKTLSRVKSGDIIVNKIWARNGSVAVINDELQGCFGSGEFPTFAPDTSKLEPAWFHWITKTSWFWDACDKKSQGTSGKNRIRPEKFLEIEIPLPSLTEQRRIVAHIEALAARVHEAQRVREEADNEIEILFTKATKEIFAKHLDSVTKIGDEFRVTTGGTPSRADLNYWEGDVRWVSSGEVAFSKICDTREKITQLGVSESNAKIYPPKTVLIAMIGQGKTRGQCAILECHAATNQNVAGIHVYETNHLPEYVYWWLRSRYLESRISETGTAQPALSGERVKQMPIPLPPLDEQWRIVAYLDGLQAKVNALRELQVESGKELSALMPSILDKAFKGELYE
jgi:type I restriction enzyme, S subunit